ncbi:hypothetical protein BOTCAL_0235g00140 [Botryotinia calthae]|uniref:Clr5 domain-containing protein n=1 Tax=Botryotinia calthae TaxID=38488 RepID=A0A4Y8CY18_9HELO|nr:hypothetical protein BOTCAL_0235g00140 [Botryotinia calthae]
MATNLDFGLDGDAMSQEFSGVDLEDFNAPEDFNYGTGRLEVELGAPDQSASSIPSWLLPSTGLYSYTQSSFPYYDIPTAPSINPAHENSSMVRPVLPPKLAHRLAPSEHSAEEWESQRSILKQLYMTEDKPLKEVMETMKNEHGFRATPRQYKRRIEQWKLDKNIKENDMRVILRKDLKRKREGKNSEFRISGREIEPKKIQRFAQRYKVTEETVLDFNVETPFYIDCDTPAPTIEDEAIQYHTREEDSTKDSTTLLLPTVITDQNRETQILKNRKTLLNQFARKLGVTVSVDSTTLDLSAFKYSPELDDASDEVFDGLISYKIYQLHHSSSLDIRSWVPNTKLSPSCHFSPYDVLLMERSHQIPRSILLFALCLLEQSHSKDDLIQGDFKPVCGGHTFKYMLCCSITYYFTELGFAVDPNPPRNIPILGSLDFDDILRFLEFHGQILRDVTFRPGVLDLDLLLMGKLCIDEWDTFVDKAKNEVKHLNDLDGLRREKLFGTEGMDSEAFGEYSRCHSNIMKR